MSASELSSQQGKYIKWIILAVVFFIAISSLFFFRPLLQTSENSNSKKTHMDTFDDFGAKLKIKKAKEDTPANIKEPVTAAQEPPSDPPEDPNDDVDMDSLMRSQILAKRMNSAKSFTRNTQTNQSHKDRNKDPNWDKYGAASEFASYPVDMDRVITVDMQIPCSLRTGIISTLPGKVICTITGNIYGRSSDKILIPTGSVAVGWYEGIAKIGEARLAVNWKRIITDDGISIVFQTAMSSADMSGNSGIPGDLDTRAWEKYGGAAMLALADTGGNIALAKNLKHGVTLNQFKAGFNQVGQAMILENIKLKPIITVQPSKNIILVPQTDIWFPESRNRVILARDINWGDDHNARR